MAFLPLPLRSAGIPRTLHSRKRVFVFCVVLRMTWQLWQVARWARPPPRAPRSGRGRCSPRGDVRTLHSSRLALLAREALGEVGGQPFAQCQASAVETHLHGGFAQPQGIGRVGCREPSTSRSRNTARCVWDSAAMAASS